MSILSMVVIMILPSSIIKAEENYTINGYVITYNGKDYDLSTPQGNYELTEDNQNMSVQEYIDILNNVYTTSDVSSMTIHNGYEYGINELVPGDPGNGGYTYFNSM